MMRGVPFSLRVPLIVVILMVLVGVVASQLVLRSLQTVQHERVQELVRLHVNGMAVALGPAVMREDIWEVYDILDRASRAVEDHRMILTVVANRAGRILAASDPRQAAVDADIGPMAAQAQPPYPIRLSGRDTRLRVVTDLHYHDRPIGQLLSVLDVTDLIAERRQAIQLLLVGNGLATILLATGGFLLVRRMVRPLRQLAVQMTAMQGRPEAFPDHQMPNGDPELSALFRTYNRMSGEVQARIEAERRLSERERFVSLGRLSSSLAHEVNNPLGGLLNAADTIKTYAHRADVVRESSELIERGLKHLRDVVRVTLDQHRSTTGNRQLGPEDLDDLRLLFQPEASRLDQILGWHVDADAECLRSFPAGPVRQIALNLLLNAGIAAGSGGRIDFAAEAKDELTLMVSDSGPGLSQDAQDRLMGSRLLPPGGGLGLRMIRDLCHGLSGRVHYDRLDGMTRISVRLPRMDVS